ncbi:hypothetical protein MKL42_09190 [Acinetobacter sp. AOR15_HL]|uniref:hypothetical protein n=1 Tax=unclassified Acinetobacter TaxID=196816 RepID=UPI0022EA57EF|nr:MULTISPECIES: hypothetical protein [unclassified Acinetobacter]MDA3557666.1 hypothetical protein [Acinetobacter sp. AOR15_HL]MDA3570991.1 hypothetical protein [Acinetobacter sp. AOR14_HL]
MKSIRELNKLLKAYKRYSIENLAYSLKFDEKHILYALDGKDILFPHHIVGMSISYAQLAFLKIENNNADIDALNSLNLALMYAEVGRELQLKDFKRKPLDKMNVHELKKYFSEFSALIFWAILLNNKNLAKKLARQVEFCLQQQFLSDFPLSYNYFSLWAYYKWINEEFTLEAKIGGKFKDLIDNWSCDSVFLEPLLIDIANLHCEELINNDLRKYPPKFIRPPFTLLPLEIHVINKLRALDELEEISLNHPLMNTHSAKIKDFEVISDDLLEMIQISFL